MRLFEREFFVDDGREGRGQNVFELSRRPESVFSEARILPKIGTGRVDRQIDGLPILIENVNILYIKFSDWMGEISEARIFRRPEYFRVRV